MSKRADAEVEAQQEEQARLADETIQPDRGAATDQQAVVADVTVVSNPSWGPAPLDPDVEIDSGMLQLAQFQGASGSERPHPIAQPHLTRLEDWLRDNHVGAPNRTSEGFYGPKTRELVALAYSKLLGVETSNGIVGPDLVAELQRRGAPVT